jgi:ABC-type oligopeptide transport system ATPase subunit
MKRVTILKKFTKAWRPSGFTQAAARDYLDARVLVSLEDRRAAERLPKQFSGKQRQE